jgi:hypothetical protein
MVQGWVKIMLNETRVPGSGLLILLLVLTSSCDSFLASSKVFLSPNSNVPQTTNTSEPLESQIRLTNRNFIAAKLESVFGPSAKASIDAIVMNQAYHAVLGGPCNSYSEISTQFPFNVTSPDCALPAYAQAPMIPRASTARAALLTRACDRILSQDDAIFFALSQALSSSVTGINIERPNQNAILETFKLFSPTRELPSLAQSAVMKVADSQALATDAWRFVLLTFCYQPDWQVQ